MPHNRYLQKRRQTWYIRIAVPPSLVPVVGKSHIVRSLKTRDAVVARERRWEELLEIRKWFREQGANADRFVGDWLPARGVDPVVEGLNFRDTWVSADGRVKDPDTGHTERQAVRLIVSDIAEELEAKQGRDAAMTFFRIATSEVPVLKDVEGVWLENIKDQVSHQTLGHHRYAVRLLHEFDEAIVFVDQVTRRLAGRFITESLKPQRKPRTINRIVSSLSSFWTWMKRRGFVETNPWEGQWVPKKDRGRAKPKRPYSAEELVRLLRADASDLVGKRYGPAINDLLPLGLMTGARLDELCELRTEDVDQQQCTVQIQRGKTRAAKRVIPVHPLVWPIIIRRTEGAVDDELFPELPPQGPDQKKSWYTSKRFTVFRRRVLGQDDTVDFHSLRRNFATYLDRAQGITQAVHPGIIAELMGHEKGSLALSLYSGGYLVDQLRKAIDTLSDVMELDVLEAVAAAGASKMLDRPPVPAAS